MPYDLAVYGSVMATPILDAPQSRILGMHKIQERPIAIGSLEDPARLMLDL